MKKTFILLALLVMALVAMPVIAEASIGPPSFTASVCFVDSIVPLDIVALNGITASDFDSVAAPANDVYALVVAVTRETSEPPVGISSAAFAVEVSKLYYAIPTLAGLMCGDLKDVLFHAEESYVSYNPRDRMEALARDQCSKPARA